MKVVVWSISFLALFFVSTSTLATPLTYSVANLPEVFAQYVSTSGSGKLGQQLGRIPDIAAQTRQLRILSTARISTLPGQFVTWPGMISAQNLEMARLAFSALDLGIQIRVLRMFGVDVELNAREMGFVYNQVTGNPVAKKTLIRLNLIPENFESNWMGRFIHNNRYWLGYYSAALRRDRTNERVIDVAEEAKQQYLRDAVILAILLDPSLKIPLRSEAHEPILESGELEKLRNLHPRDLFKKLSPVGRLNLAEVFAGLFRRGQTLYIPSPEILNQFLARDVPNTEREPTLYITIIALFEELSPLLTWNRNIANSLSSLRRPGSISDNDLRAIAQAVEILSDQFDQTSNQRAVDKRRALRKEASQALGHLLTFVRVNHVD